LSLDPPADGATGRGQRQRHAGPIPGAAVFDTSVLVPYLSRGRYREEVARAVGAGRLWLCSVVALELYLGTRDQGEKRFLDGLTESFERRGLIVTPTHADHVLAGMLLNRQRRLVGHFEARHHLADILIVLSAAQIGATVVTENLGHLAIWATMARRTGRTVRVRAPAGET
jgi:predicted nucleic acid-binding protein